LTLKFDEPLSNVAFNFNLRRYNLARCSSLASLSLRGCGGSLQVVTLVGCVALPAAAAAAAVEQCDAALLKLDVADAPQLAALGVEWRRRPKRRRV
jgi:hypothetical protein